MVTVTQNDVAIPGLHCSFGCETTIPRPYRWHWKRDGVLIAGAQSAKAYTTPPLRVDDLGHSYSVTVFGLDGEIETSEEVKLMGATPTPIPQQEPEAVPQPVPAPSPEPAPAPEPEATPSPEPVKEAV